MFLLFFCVAVCRFYSLHSFLILFDLWFVCMGFLCLVFFWFCPLFGPFIFGAVLLFYLFVRCFCVYFCSFFLLFGAPCPLLVGAVCCWFVSFLRFVVSRSFYLS